MEKTYILDKQTAQKKLQRMALEVVENNCSIEEIILLGIKKNGIIIAHQMAQYLKPFFKESLKVVSVEMDKKNPTNILFDQELDYDNKTILLIDDVANTGKTMMYALKPLLDKHPAKIQTLALLERTHKNFPIEVDYVGLSISSTLNQYIYVEVITGEINGAWLETKLP